MMLAAPELVVTERIELLDKIEVLGYFAPNYGVGRAKAIAESR